MAGFSREAGVPGSQFALMRILAKAGQDAGIMEIARELGINAAAVTRIVKDLEAERLVLRHGDAKDRRRSYVRLSARGLKIFKEVHDRSHQLERALSAVISAREIETTLSVLAKLRNLIEGLS
jgi:DNA-binding MarR family transcriptional regulator